jgi:hypothetical protein
MGEGHAFLTIFPKIFNICKIDRFEVFVDINEWKLIKVLLMKALAQNGWSELSFSNWFFSVIECRFDKGVLRP